MRKSPKVHVKTAVFVVAACCSALHAQKPLQLVENDGTESRITQLLQQMTIEEKIGQLNLEPGRVIPGTEIGPSDGVGLHIAHGSVGALIGATGAKEVNAYQKIAVEQTRLHIPLLFGFDVIHGYHTLFPVPLALAASFDPELVQQVAGRSGAEARLDGVNWVYSPMVDIARDARWGRVVEGAGEDTFLGSAMAHAWVAGYQRNDLHNPLAVATCVKHFAAYGAPIAGRDYNAVDMSELTLRQYYLPPYKAAVDAGALCVMSAFNSLNGVPETANPFTLRTILRKEWGFKGFVVSDAGAIKELIAHGTALDEPDAAHQAFIAGVDMDMGSSLYLKQLKPMADADTVPSAVLDEAVRHILRAKFALGLFEHPYVTQDTAGMSLDRKLTRKAAEESFVLLKNNSSVNGTNALPIGSGIKTIALIGPLADARNDMLGSWPGKGNAATVVTLHDALMAAASERSIRVICAKGAEMNSESQDGFREAIAAARRADIVVLALGEGAGAMTGEARSRASIGLPGIQEKLVDAIATTGKTMVLVLFNGRPLAITHTAKQVQSILDVWFPGIEAGPAIVSTLFGDSNPSGKLPISFPRSVGQTPIYYNATATGRPSGRTDLSRPPANNQERFVSRYIDEDNKPLFPFGWGLSYTHFTYSDLHISGSCSVSHAETCSLVITSTITNTGKRTGDEVTQLYIRMTGASVEQPLRELKGFHRITLKPGESRAVQFVLDHEALSFYNAQLMFGLEPVKLQFWIGGNSDATTGANAQILP